MMNRQALGEVLRALRRQRGLKQRELAAAVGKSQTAIGQYETGEKLPSTETIFVLDQYFQGQLLDNSGLRPWACGGGV